MGLGAAEGQAAALGKKMQEVGGTLEEAMAMADGFRKRVKDRWPETMARKGLWPTPRATDSDRGELLHMAKGATEPREGVRLDSTRSFSAMPWATFPPTSRSW